MSKKVGSGQVELEKVASEMRGARSQHCLDRGCKDYRSYFERMGALQKILSKGVT